MKVTTVRFSDDLWATIADEAAIAGVSASQFIREAALARAAAAAGARGELPFRSIALTLEEIRGAVQSPSHQTDVEVALTQLSRALAGAVRSDSQALRAESQQARGRADELMRRGARRRQPKDLVDEPDS